MREVQALADLAVRQTLSRKLGDLQLLSGQLIAGLDDATAAPFATRAQLLPRLVAPWRAPQCVEGVARGTQRAARLRDTAVTSQPLAVRELNPSALERPPCQIARQRLLEPLAGLCRLREERARLLEAQPDPRARPLTQGRLELRHARSRFIEPVDVARSIGEIRDQPRGDHRVVRGVGRVEQPVSG